MRIRSLPLAVAMVGSLGCASGQPHEAKATAAQTGPVALFYSDVELAPGRRFPSPLARGSVAGRPTVFVIDTGAQVSVVSTTVAREAGLESVAAEDAQDPSGNKVETRRTENPRIALDGLGALPDRPTAVVTLPPILERLGIGGIVSPQALADRDRTVILDLPHGELRVVPANASQPSTRGGALAMPEANLCRYEQSGFSARALTLPAKVEGIDVTLEVDTGASGSFVVAEGAPGRLLGARTDAAQGKAVSAGTTATTETRRLEGVRVQFGSVDTKGPVLVVPGARDEHCGYEGRLGIDRLRACVLVIEELRIHGRCDAPSGS